MFVAMHNPSTLDLKMAQI